MEIDGKAGQTKQPLNVLLMIVDNGMKLLKIVINILWNIIPAHVRDKI